MYDSCPVEDFWGSGWDGCFSPSESLGSSLPLPRSPSHLELFGGSPLGNGYPFSGGPFENLLSDFKESPETDDPLKSSLSSLLGLVENSPTLQTPSLDFINEWESASLHNALPSSLEDYMLRPVSTFNDNLLGHLLQSGSSKHHPVMVRPTLPTPALEGPFRSFIVSRSGSGSPSPSPSSSPLPSPSPLPKVQGAPNFRLQLIKCAEAVMSGDRLRGKSLLAELHSQASPFGASPARLTYYFAEALAVRIAGFATPMSGNLWTAASYIPSLPSLLECYYQYRKLSPYMRITLFLANETILKATEGASRIHLLELSSPCYQQWSDLISALARRKGGPPALLRITGIVISDVPVFGSSVKDLAERAAGKIAEYACSLGVPFESSVWLGRAEDLHDMADTLRQSEEVLVVNSIYNLHTLADETVDFPSPRDMYLQFLQKLRPRVFVQAEVCGSFGAPFFLTRFREALSYFESYFDMLDTTVDEELTHLVSKFFGAIIQNVVAFEGVGRVERPQKYKQWKQRVEASGFEQVPLDGPLREKAMAMIRVIHKEFWVGEEDNWLVVGWKGRLAHAITSWRPKPGFSTPLVSGRRCKRGRIR